MKSIMLAAQNIQTGQRDLMVAGGMESMSSCPYALLYFVSAFGLTDQMRQILLRAFLEAANTNFHS